MLRYDDLNEISDGRLYSENDMVKADTHGCNGCSKCCESDMGNSIVLDPYDIYNLTKGTGRYNDKGFDYILQTGECVMENRSKIKVDKWLGIEDLERHTAFINKWHRFLKFERKKIFEIGERAGNEINRLKTITEQDLIVYAGIVGDSEVLEEKGVEGYRDRKCEAFRQDADKEQSKDREHDGLDGPASFLLKKGDADVVPGNAAEPCDEAQQKEDFPVHQVYGQRRYIGGEVDGFGNAVCLSEAEVGECRQQQDQEGSRTGAVKAVVHADYQRNAGCDERGLQRREFRPAFVQVAGTENVESCERQNHQHDPLKERVADQQCEVGADVRADQRGDDAGQRLLPGNIMRKGKLGGCDGGAHGGAELVGGDGVVHRQPGDHVGGERNQPAAARHGVDKTAQKHQRADDQIGQNSGCLDHAAGPLYSKQSMVRSSNCSAVLTKPSTAFSIFSRVCCGEASGS